MRRPTRIIGVRARWGAVVAAAAALVVLPGQAAAATLPPTENPAQTFRGDLCRYADTPQGYQVRNQVGEGRVYQLAYREPDERGLGQGHLYVYVNDAGWLKRQNGGWHMGARLGEVVIGCGTG